LDLNDAAAEGKPSAGGEGLPEPPHQLHHPGMYCCFPLYVCVLRILVWVHSFRNTNTHLLKNVVSWDKSEVIVPGYGSRGPGSIPRANRISVK
jgi:hypothetical protein